MCKTSRLLWILTAFVLILGVKQCANTQLNSATQGNNRKSSQSIHHEEYSADLHLEMLLLELAAKMDYGHCYVVLFDEVYESVLNAAFFRQIHRAARYIVKIEQDEDTFNPRPSLKCILESTKKAGCGGYILLMANGIQMARLLRFGDDTRIIDTRARYIMMHNYRLFVPQLHYIWKRIVNVLFVRQLRDRRARLYKSGNDKFAPVYELSTVPFPMQIKGVFYSKILNFWQGGKFRLANSTFFDDKTKDLRRQEMRVVVLEHTPAVFKSATTSVAIPSSHTNDSDFSNNASAHQLTLSRTQSRSNYYGLEIELLKAISNAMHFQMVFYETSDADTERWGRLGGNGTLTGIIKEMQEGKADFALADLHHTEYNLGFMDLSVPYNTECLTFLTPEALSDNSWKTLILPFNGEMWAGVLLSLFAVGFVFYAFSNTLMYIHQHERGYRPEHDLLQRHRNRKGKEKRNFWTRFRKNRDRTNTPRKSKLIGRLKWLRHKKPKTNMSKSSAYDRNKLKKLRMIPFKRQPEPWHDPLPANDMFDTFSDCIIYTYSMLLLVSLPRIPEKWPLRMLTGWYWVYCVLVVVAYRASFTAILANPIPRVTIDTLQDLAESSVRCGAWGEQNRLFFQMAQDQYSQTIGAKLEHAPNHNEAVEKVSEGLYAYYENIYSLRQLRSTRKSEKARQTLHIMQECAVHMPISIGLGKNSPLKHQVDLYVRALIEGGLTRKWLSDAIEQFQSNVEIPPQEAIIDLKKMYAGIVALCFGYVIALFAFVVEKIYWRYYIENNPAFDKYLHGIVFRGRR
uniref:Ionotropic glutamate receptor L-glutamate and glycine-binding domain-containing protein n=1 Tax=Anopheles arabiensis TaxID=7173 RepID=A0A8W7MTN7_ANOAR